MSLIVMRHENSILVAMGGGVDSSPAAFFIRDPSPLNQSGNSPLKSKVSIPILR